MSKVGIEVEVESTLCSQTDIQRAVEEGTLSKWELDTGERSLRAGMFGWEIKTTGAGIPYESVASVLGEIYPLLAGSTGVWRAGVHVHVDVSTLSLPQRALALAVAYTVDYSLFDLVSPERVESNFCVPLERKSCFVLRLIEEWAQSILGQGYGKYSSVNVDSVRTFGTFEFRHMRTPACDGTVASVTGALQQVRRFVTAAHSIINWVHLYAGGELNSPADVLAAYIRLVGSPRLLQHSGLQASTEAVLAVCMRLGNPAHRQSRRSITLSMPTAPVSNFIDILAEGPL